MNKTKPTNQTKRAMSESTETNKMSEKFKMNHPRKSIESKQTRKSNGMSATTETNEMWLGFKMNNPRKSIESNETRKSNETHKSNKMSKNSK